jgi:hypothetical protein
MKNYFKKCLAFQKKEFAIASTFLRGKYKMRNVCRRFHIHHLYCGEDVED